MIQWYFVNLLIKIPMTPLHDKTNPFLASIKSRHPLSKVGSKKEIFHIELDLAHSGLTYQVGDSLGVFALNDPELVEKTIKALKATGEEIVFEKQTNAPWPLWDFLEKKANITEMSRKLLQEVMQRQTDPTKKAQLELLFEEGNKEKLKSYLESHEIWDLLLENEEAVFPLQELCNLLMPMLPRLYSISSSMHAVGEEVHLTIASLQYESNGHLRKGVCTHYLCHLAPVNQPVVPVYLQPHHGFTLPEDHRAPIIMIGPGTGVAPFRAFMQERLSRNALGKNWLFFGEWHRSHHFFYEEFWKELEKQEKLRLSLAFSRDQAHKIYVQHQMLEHGDELYQWIKEGAYLYVCGDAHQMAKDVDATLHQIVQRHGNMDEMAAKSFIKQLRQDKRYLKDVY